MQVSKPKKGYKFVDVGFGNFEEIPEEWRYEELKDKILILSGFSFKSEFFDNKHGIPLIRIRDLSHKSTKIFYNGEYSEDFLVNEGDLLIGMDGEFKPHIWKGEKSLLNQRVCKVTTKDFVKLNQKLLYYAIKKGLNYYENVNIGTTVGHLSKFDIEKIKIGLPKNILEQQKIASILTNVDNTLEKTNQLIQKTILLKKGLMQKLLAKGIGHTEFKKTEIGEIPKEWDVVALEKLGTWNGGGTPSKSNQTFWTNGNIPWITPKDMKTNMIYDSIDKITPEAIKKSTGKIIKSNSILFVVRSGILQRMLPIAITKVDVVINQDLKALTVQKEINSSYIFHTVQSLSENIRHSCSKVGTTVESIVVPLLLKYSVPLPPLSEQKQIASIISNVDSQITKEKLQKSNLELLKKGLMQKLLTGQIRFKV